MDRSSVRIRLAMSLGIACLAIIPGKAAAQYNCPVAIDLKGKAVLAGQIRDEKRPATEELWKMLETLSFARTKDGQGLPDPKSVESTTLKGEILVRIDGAGQVKLEELRLVRNKFNASAWVIAPEDFGRILKLRKESGGSD